MFMDSKSPYSLLRSKFAVRRSDEQQTSKESVVSKPLIYKHLTPLG
jgi:hypothetical protein